jgi:hypothetical protein
MDEMLATGADRCRALSAVIALLTVAACLSVSRDASAAPAARLVYAREAGAESCPDEGALRRAVATRMGHDPFSAAAALTVRVEITAVDGHLRGRVVLETEGVESGSQVIDEPRRHDGARVDCGDLLDSIALAVSVALDADRVLTPEAPAPPPLRANEQVPPAPPPPPEVKKDAALEAGPDAPPPVASGRGPGDRRLSLWAAPGVRVAFDAWSRTAVAPDLFVEARYRGLGLGVEARYDLPVTVHVGSNDLATVDRGTAALLPCVHVGWFSACAVAAAGVTRARGTTPSGSEITPPYVALGGRAGADVALVPRFHLLGTVDLDGVLTPVRIVGGSANTESLPVEASAGIAVLVSIF